MFYLPSNWNLYEKKRRRRLGQRISKEEKKSINSVFRGFTQLLLYVLSDISHEGWSGRAEIAVCLVRLSLPCCYREILSCKREINSRFPLYFLLRLAILSFAAQTAEPKKAEKDFANKLKCFGHKQWENENGNSRCGRKDQKKIMESPFWLYKLNSKLESFFSLSSDSKRKLILIWLSIAEFFPSFVSLFCIL